ncbi:MAG TPA: hypothetical protein VKU89_10090 [Solirubrobacteraceae bacterium]|nr:hypothetical protein [Solirubrobacteraceae bacterium]
MAKRKPRRPKAPKLKAPTSDYSDAEGNVLSLRGSLTAATRTRYAATLAGAEQSAASTIEDSSQRALELLFEHLAVRWVIAGAPIERQRDLLARLRMASRAERAWVRETLRRHCAECFPEVKVP